MKQIPFFGLILLLRCTWALVHSILPAVLLIAPGLARLGAAQTPRDAQRRVVRHSSRRPSVPSPAQQLPVLQWPLVDFVPSPIVNIAVRTEVDTTIRLGLAPGGVTMVEFPAGDFVFSYFPGDENFVTLDEAMVRRGRPTDPLVFRPGAGFAVPPPGTGKLRPYGQLTVQMVSGLVFTFHIYPVRDLGQSTSRVALSYQPEEVVAQRRRLGLPTNLHLRRMSAGPVGVPEKSDEITASERSVAESGGQRGETGTVLSEDSASSLTFTPSPPTPTPAPLPTPSVLTTTAQARQVAAQAVVNGAGSPVRRPWQKPVHGLSLALQPTHLVLQGAFQLDILFVKNTLSQPLKLVNLPELLIETRGAERKAINQERWEVTALAHNLPADGLLQPGRIYCFALVSHPPILGIAQFLRIAVAQTNAADDPASLPLLESAR